MANWNDLRTFVLLSQHRSLSEAALNLGMSQPALSRTLKRLEGSLGLTLFLRGRSGLALTPEGKRILSRAAEWAKAGEAIWEDRAEASQSSTLVIGAHPTVAIDFLPALYKKLEGISGLKLEFKMGLSKDIIAQVRDGLVHLGIVANAGKTPDLVFTNLSHENVNLYGSLEKSKPGFRLFVHPQFQKLERALKQIHKIANWKIESIENYEVILSLAKEKLGFALLPEHIARREKSLRLFKGLSGVDLPIDLVWKASLRDSPRLKEVVRALRLRPLA